MKPDPVCAAIYPANVCPCDQSVDDVSFDLAKAELVGG